MLQNQSKIAEGIVKYRKANKKTVEKNAQKTYKFCTYITLCICFTVIYLNNKFDKYYYLHVIINR